MIGMKDQCFGVEVEMTGLTRGQAAQALANYFGTEPYYVGGGYDKWSVKDPDGKAWSIMSDSSIVTEMKTESGYMHTSNIEYRVEMVTPKLTYAELPRLQECVRQVRHAGAKVNHSCGIHVHVDAANHNRQSLKNLLSIMYSKEDKGQPTFRSMLESDLRTAIQDANDLGHFFLLMEHMGYEIHHGDRLGFRLRGQERFQYPGRRNTLFTEDGIRAAIQGNLAEIEAGSRPTVLSRPKYRPYLAHPKYTGFLALYVHYLYLLGKIGQRQYPPRMTPHLRREVMRFEQYRTQFDFLRENEIVTQADMDAFQTRTEESLAKLIKQRTILNVRKKKRQKLYTALADVEALAPSKALYEEGLTGMEAEFERYMEAVALLESSGVPRNWLTEEKAEIYEQLAELNREIRTERQKLKLCHEIQNQVPVMEQDIQRTEEHQKEVREHEHRRR